jgi:hypothetical protein
LINSLEQLACRSDVSKTGGGISKFASLWCACAGRAPLWRTKTSFLDARRADEAGTTLAEEQADPVLDRFPNSSGEKS